MQKRKPRRLSCTGLQILLSLAITSGTTFPVLNAQTGTDSMRAPEHIAISVARPADPPKMQFEVAAIHLAKEFSLPLFPISPDDSYRPTGGRFLATFPLPVYIEFAYKLWLTPEEQDSMLANVPRWVSSELFLIDAKAEGNPTKDDMRLMMQSLLADRFKLALHFETRTMPVFTLELRKRGKTGPDLRPHGEGPPCNPQHPDRDFFPSRCDVYMKLPGDHGQILFGSRNTTMELIADSLAQQGRLGRPVVDRTGLTGRYDFRLQWARESAPEPANDASAPAPAEGPGFIEAVQDQLGLMLKPATALVRVPVIDHVEKPTEN